MQEYLQHPSVEVRNILEEIKFFFGGVGEPWTTLAVAPSILNALWDGTRKVLESGVFDIKTKLMIGFEAAKADGCTKCKNGFKTMLTRIGLESETVERLEGDIGSPNLDEKVTNILIFSSKAAREPHSIDNSTITAFRLLGISDLELIELVVVLNAFRSVIEINHMLSIH